MKTALPLLIILCAATSYAIEIELFYGEGCPHCASTSALLDTMKDEYNLSISKHEAYYNYEERTRLIAYYERFGYDVSKGGVPTTIVGGTAMVVGELSESQWKMLFDACQEGRCPTGVYTYSTFTLRIGNQSAAANLTGNGTAVANATAPANDTRMDPLQELNGAAAITLPVLIGAALVDSINPCTIAVMVLLCGAILCAKGRNSALLAGLIFSFVIFFMYVLYGLGIMKAIAALELTRAFYTLVTLGALALALMEINAYFNYKPGFLAVEMPMFLRPYAKKITASATSPAGVAVAAVFCSLFLLPCSSGPYLLVLGMLAKAATMQTIGYLVLYNLFFILPMVVITVAVYLGKTTIEKVNETKEKYIRLIHLVSGIILFFLFLLMLGQATGWY
ncbi:hypothetical protein L0Y65_01770 [Candidatus Micrarchaeota archaeon]|nr:hypothetical protein [Candidatus Micrarchaeota archaeon]